MKRIYSVEEMEINQVDEWVFWFWLVDWAVEKRADTPLLHNLSNQFQKPQSELNKSLTS